MLGVLVNLSPSLVYILEHGRNRVAVGRAPMLTEFYGLKVVQLLLPITGHRLRLFASFKDKYNASGFLINENDLSSLGIFASIGFLCLIARLLYRRNSESQSPWLDCLSILNIFAILLATIGGFGSVFGISVSSWIRCYNRMSVFIGLFSLVAVAVLADDLLQ